MQKSYPEQLQPEDVLFFLHIPKTAGTSLTQELTRNWRKDLILTPEQLNTAKAQPRERLAKAKFIYGHFSRAVCRRRLPNPPTFTITFLRDPTDHYLSLYHHLQRDPNFAYTTRITLGDRDLSHRITELARSHSLQQFMAEPESHLFSNFQSKYLVRGMRFQPDVSERPELKALAKKCLLELGAFGITSRYEDSLLQIGRALNLKRSLRARSTNMAPNRKTGDALSNAIREEIKARTRYDQELFDSALAIFETRLAMPTQEHCDT